MPIDSGPKAVSEIKRAWTQLDILIRFMGNNTRESNSKRHKIKYDSVGLVYDRSTWLFNLAKTRIYRDGKFYGDLIDANYKADGNVELEIELPSGGITYATLKPRK